MKDDATSKLTLAGTGMQRRASATTSSAKPPLPIETGLFFTLALVVRQRQINTARVNDAEDQVFDEGVHSLGTCPAADRLTEAAMGIIAGVIG